MNMASGQWLDLEIEGQVAVEIINNKTNRGQHESNK